MKELLFSSIFLSAMLVGCGGGTETAATTTTPTTTPVFDSSSIPQTLSPSALPQNWWQQGAMMQIYVRSYRDKSGDGKGDLLGVIEKLDYLKNLGVKGIWLTPIFKSQDKDHGYSVVDYRAIDSDLGTLADFDALIKAAHDRGIGVIIDYAANHAGSEHPAFVDSRKTTSSYRNWFVWRDTDPLGWTTWNRDKTNPWTSSGSDGVYYAVFSASMPDWNFDKTEVLNFHKSNLRFWLNRGVDGVRFDAVSEFKNLDGGTSDDISSAIVSQQLAETVKSYPNRWVICEASTSEIQAKWSPARHANSCGAAFGFPVNFIFNEITASIDPGKGKAKESLEWYFQTFPSEKMGTLLGNHDYFTATLDDDYKGREYDILNADLSAYKFAAALNLLSPGIPFIYYGEEIGMSKQTHDGGPYEYLRAPMSWDNNSGFSSVTPYRSYALNRAQFNVENEATDNTSLLSWYKTLLSLRNLYPVLQKGVPEQTIDGGLSNGAAFVYTRVLDSQRVWLVFNPGKTVSAVTSSKGGTVHEIFNPNNVTVSTSGAGLKFENIPPRGVAVFLN